MAKKAKKKKKTPKKKRPPIPELEVKITPAGTDLQDVEGAIAAKLGMQSTDLFKENDKVIIVVEKIGKAHSGL